MQYIFVFGPIAITVHHWVELGANGTEEGPRVEIRRVEYEAPLSPYASTVTTLRDLLWRADLFGLVGGEPGNWQRAHYHNALQSVLDARARNTEPPERLSVVMRAHLAGMAPLDRLWDAQLSEDPIKWIAARLEDLPGTLTAAGAADLAASIDEAEYRPHVPAIVAAVEACRTAPALQSAVAR